MPVKPGATQYQWVIMLRILMESLRRGEEYVPIQRLRQQCAINGLSPHRMKEYIWDVRKRSGAKIRTVLDGKKTVGYALEGVKVERKPEPVKLVDPPVKVEPHPMVPPPSGGWIVTRK